jgi:hypothetical protein
MADQTGNADEIHIKIGREREVPTRFKIKRFKPMAKLFNAYCERLVSC